MDKVVTSFKVVGLPYADQDAVADMESTDNLCEGLTLAHEPNEYDENAVSVRWNGTHIGWVNRERAEAVSRALDFMKRYYEECTLHECTPLYGKRGDAGLQWFETKCEFRCRKH